MGEENINKNDSRINMIEVIEKVYGVNFEELDRKKANEVKAIQKINELREIVKDLSDLGVSIDGVTNNMIRIKGSGKTAMLKQYFDEMSIEWCK